MAAEQEGSTGTVKVRPSSDDLLVVESEYPETEPDELFNYWTKPELLMQWWPVEAEVEPVAGGEYHFAWPEKDRHLRGEYTAYEPGRQLGFTWRWEHEPERPERNVTVQMAALKEGGKGTKVVVTHGRYSDSAEESEEKKEYLEGWTRFLERLGEATAKAAEERPKKDNE